MTTPEPIAALAAQLQARRQIKKVQTLHLLPRIDLDDPALLSRLTDTVEGHDDAPKAVPVKAHAEPSLPFGVLSVEQGAAYLGVSPDQLKGLIADGEVQYINLGRGKKRPRIGVTIPDLDETIKNRRQRAVAPCPSTRPPRARTTSSASNVVDGGFMARRKARLDAKRKR